MIRMEAVDGRVPDHHSDYWRLPMGIEVTETAVREIKTIVEQQELDAEKIQSDPDRREDAESVAVTSI